VDLVRYEGKGSSGSAHFLDRACESQYLREMVMINYIESHLSFAKYN
jgi:hypothetical protein